MVANMLGEVLMARMNIKNETGEHLGMNLVGKNGKGLVTRGDEGE